MGGRLTLGVMVHGTGPGQGGVSRVAITGLSGVMLAACASAAGSGHGASGTVARAAGSCAVASAAASLASARVVFIGTAQPGPTTAAGSAGPVLISPARFRVTRYLKGNGPRVVTVRTAVSNRGHAMIASEDGIEPRAGQRWRIYTTSLHLPYQTSLCGGSCLMSGLANTVNIPCAQQRRRK